MKDATPQPVFLADYQPPAWLIDDVHLTFRLHPTATRVISKIRFRPNPDVAEHPFRLDGKNLTLISAAIDGERVTPATDTDGLSLNAPAAPFTWECEVEINPDANTELEGLYTSNGLFCTQCEAQGFRKITYYPDRPDVMAPFTVRLEGDQPVLLSNGNEVESGDGFAIWRDPWPKPSYLFALVAGDLVAHSGAHRTADGRDVALNIWVRPGDQDRCAYALDSLQRSMRWDEEVYGRNYDLNVFNLVAVDDFNAGAMENKGLNIFNSKYVLASPETATDRDYEFIEGIVAHEYFHNWTGNRITCRDWFQLCLKEGLTVFRDQQFSGDMRGHAVKRIDDVRMLRASQFREDAGPLAHPVRPESYIEINNFYTATVYEKGAEVIRMLKTLVGDEGYGSALDLYFNRHDGQACTIEDWLAVFEDACDEDLAQFKLWYSQSGTPILNVTEKWNADAGVFTLTVQQRSEPTPNQPEKQPFRMDVRFALLSADGEVIPHVGERKLAIEKAEHVVSVQNLKGMTAKPILSFNRDFSAPVIVEHQQSRTEQLVLFAHDSDPFNRWEAGRGLAKDQLINMIVEDANADTAYLDALGTMLGNDALDPAFRAFSLGLPSEDDLAQSLHKGGRTPDPLRIHACREALQTAIANAHAAEFTRLYDAMMVQGPYRPDASDAGKRSLRLAALDALSRTEGTAKAHALFDETDNMTERLGALAALLRRGDGHTECDAFFETWQADPNVLDKWFSLQISCAAPENAHEIAQRLTQHAAFNWKTPNRFRAVIGAFVGNTAAFHAEDGSGYDFIAHWLCRLDPINPMTAARMATVFETWARYDGDRQGQMRDAVKRLLHGSPSRDMTEIGNRILG